MQTYPNHRLNSDYGNGSGIDYSNPAIIGFSCCMSVV